MQESATRWNEEPVNPAPVLCTSEESVATSRPRQTVRMPEKYKDYKLYQFFGLAMNSVRVCFNSVVYWDWIVVSL